MKWFLCLLCVLGFERTLFSRVLAKFPACREVADPSGKKGKKNKKKYWVKCSFSAASFAEGITIRPPWFRLPVVFSVLRPSRPRTKSATSSRQGVSGRVSCE